eukprot:1357743-Prymnesium_polylepis.1
MATRHRLAAAAQRQRLNSRGGPPGALGLPASPTSHASRDPSSVRRGTPRAIGPLRSRMGTGHP